MSSKPQSTSTADSATAGFVPEYSADAHNGSAELASCGLSTAEVERAVAAGKVNTEQ